MLIKGGKLITEQGVFKKDLQIKGEKIVALAENLRPQPQEQVIDATDLLVMPGLIDAHTHFALKARGTITCDDAAKGSLAALKGGVTTVIDFVDFQRCHSIQAMINKRCQEFAAAAVDYTFHLTINNSFTVEDLAGLKELKKQGLGALKLFTTYPQAGYMLEKKMLQAIFEKAAELDLLISVHCEDNDIIEKASQQYQNNQHPLTHTLIRPPQAEAEGVRAIIALARKYQANLYLMHISSALALEEIAKAKADNLNLYCETTPHYLLLNDTLLKGSDAPLFIMTPPLRKREDQKALQQALEQGIIDVIATDHCAFYRQDKFKETAVTKILPGIPGIENLLELIYSYFVVPQHITLSKMIELLSVNPAKIYNLYPQKGSLAVGSDADIILYSPQGSRILKDQEVVSASKFTPYRGFKVYGQLISTILRGQIVNSNQKLSPIQGRFIERRN